VERGKMEESWVVGVWGKIWTPLTFLGISVNSSSFSDLANGTSDFGECGLKRCVSWAVLQICNGGLVG
jgi:hypothetical protein